LHQRGRPSQTKAIVDLTIKKIASGADEGEDMRSYAKKLIRRFDLNKDGIISFQELC
jgi:Ca2+-binding EF-hand superfamily protein